MYVNSVPSGQISTNVYTVSLNKAILRDSWLSNSYDVQNLTYTSIKKGYSVGQDYAFGSLFKPMISLNIFSDPKVEVNERIRYTILNAIQDFGGFASVLMQISAFLFYFI